MIIQPPPAKIVHLAVPPVQPFLGPGREDFTHLFTGRSRNLHPRTWPEPGPLPDLQPPERSQSPPARGGLTGAKNGSSSLGFHGQPQGSESRADTKRAPVALILGEQAPHPRRRAASQSQGPASAPAARAGLGRNVEALQMERRGASPAARKECRAAPRRARMERETLTAAPSPSPRPAGALGPRELRRRGAGGAAGLNLTHTQHRAPRLRALPVGGFEPPTFCSPRGREEGRWARKRKGRAVRALCPLPSGRSRPCARLPSPLALGAAPPPAWLALVGGTPSTPGRL
uniref:Synapsin-1-like n=1 Tax=Castor canadensis TaxID=51338 RepID=A0A8B7VLZ9_CASCN|nr:synapsin-1-like [Castor canadensis]